MLDDRGSHLEDQMEELSCNMEHKYKEMEIMSEKIRARMLKLGDFISE